MSTIRYPLRLVRSLLTLLILPTAIFGAPAEGGPVLPVPERTESTYESLARQFMGFDDDKGRAVQPKATSVGVITTSKTSTPFQTEVFAGERVWHVCFESVQLTLDRTKRGDKAADPRDFHIYFDSASGDLLRIISRATDYDLRNVDKPCRLDPELCYKPDLIVEEVPETVVRAGFIGALNVVMGVDPSDAAEIVGRYVQLGSFFTDEVRPVWVINMIGLPASIGACGNEDLPREVLTHEDCVVDAVTGSCITCGMPPVIRWDDPAKAEAANRPRTSDRALHYEATAAAVRERAIEKAQAEQTEPE